MNFFDEQTINDLEFDLIRLMLHDYCHGATARLRMVDLVPIAHPKNIEVELFRTNEFLQIRKQGLPIPRIDFEEMEKEIELLGYNGSILEEISFSNLLNNSRLINDLIKFFKKNEEFGYLSELMKSVYFTLEIIKPIEKVFDPKGIIKDDASNLLSEIRKNIISERREISKNFNKVIKRYRDQGWLADTTEAYVNNRRVLAVESTHKRKVEGSILGSSKTGSITFIEPKETIRQNFELEILFDDERKEILRILRQLTEELRESLPLIISYQKLLTEFDFIRAKTRLAIELDAVLPGLVKEPRIELIDAFHPILLLTNKKAMLPTYPQSLMMDKFSRMLVISGPNAGGKSITLKTVGLLQIMLQSGILIPVNPNSKMCFFQNILSDIGDNQSIENQLSTYSYRLRRMKLFLEVTNRKTLLLLDEFGTGSDPDLGGALAEVFFEKLYSRKCFGVITTHYANIKMKAAALKNTLNGCMLFDEDSLEPLFQLSLGQPGSSFTFEVAEKNGISKDIIDLAKGKLDSRNIKMDKLISKLTKEKSKTEKLNKIALLTSDKAAKSQAYYDAQVEKIHQKNLKQQKLAEQNNQFIRKGKKMNSFINLYNISSPKNKKLLDEVRKYLAVEKTKIVEDKKAVKLKQALKKKTQKKKSRNQNIAKIHVGCSVRLGQGKEQGTVLDIKGKEVTIAFGNFMTKAEINKLIYVRS